MEENERNLIVRCEGRLADRHPMEGQKTPSCCKPSWTEGLTEDDATEIGLKDPLPLSPNFRLSQLPCDIRPSQVPLEDQVKTHPPAYKVENKTEQRPRGLWLEDVCFRMKLILLIQISQSPRFTRLRLRHCRTTSVAYT